MSDWMFWIDATRAGYKWKNSKMAFYFYRVHELSAMRSTNAGKREYYMSEMKKEYKDYIEECGMEVTPPLSVSLGLPKGGIKNGT
jgi:hypothetical protein